MDNPCHSLARAPPRHAKAPFPSVIAVPLALALLLSACGGAGTGSPTPEGSSGTPSLIPATPVESAASPGPTPAPPVLPPVQSADAGATFSDSRVGWVAYVVSPAEPAPSEIHFWRTSSGGQEWESGGRVDLSGFPDVAPI